MTPVGTLLAPVVLAVMLAASALGKARSPGTVAASFRDLRVPGFLDRPVLRTLFPWAEAVLAVALMVTPGGAAPIPAGCAVVLMAAYWRLIARALRRGEPVSCGCFGAADTEPVSGRTLGRNTMALVLAAVWFLVSLRTSAPQLLLAARGADLVWLVGTALACAVLYLSMPRGREASPVNRGRGESGHDPSPGRGSAVAVPDVVVRDAAGRELSLADLARREARLVVAVSPGCGPCAVVMGEATAWREAAHPARVHLLSDGPMELVRRRTDPAVMRDALEDLDGRAIAALGLGGTPAAVLIGSEGVLAGPARGPQDIRRLVERTGALLG